jgi:hypothetical protein
MSAKDVWFILKRKEGKTVYKSGDYSVSLFPTASSSSSAVCEGIKCN